MQTSAQIHKELLRTFQDLGSRHNVYTAFEDFLAMYVMAISNQVDGYHYEQREQQYLQLAKKYTAEELEQMAHIGVLLTMAFERQGGIPQDVLGPVFHDLELHNKYHGQFFSPQSICDMMAEVTISPEMMNQEKSYFSVYEPACGSGAMVLAAAGRLQSLGWNYQQQMLAVCVDVDFKCVCMAYIQLALHGIPAIVIHGNTLYQEEQSSWYTPMYFMGEWFWREPDIGNMKRRKPEIEAFRLASNPMYRALRQFDALIKKEPAKDIIPETVSVITEAKQPVTVLELKAEPIKPAKKKRKQKDKVEQLTLFSLAADNE